MTKLQDNLIEFTFSLIVRSGIPAWSLRISLLLRLNARPSTVRSRFPALSRALKSPPLKLKGLLCTVNWTGYGAQNCCPITTTDRLFGPEKLGGWNWKGDCVCIMIFLGKPLCSIGFISSLLSVGVFYLQLWSLSLTLLWFSRVDFEKLVFKFTVGHLFIWQFQ